MTPITLYKHLNGDWVTTWMNHTHVVTLNANDDLSFLSLGIVDRTPVRIEVNQRGIILDVTNNTTAEELTSITIPVNHSLYREINIGRPL